MSSSTARLRFCSVLMRSGLPSPADRTRRPVRSNRSSSDLLAITNDRHRDGAQASGDFLIERQHALARVDHEQDHVGRVDREVDLLFDVPREVVHVRDAHAARIDQFEKPVIMAHEMCHAIAGDAGLVIDNGNPDAGKPIEQAALADVRPANDDNLRYAHYNTNKLATAI